MNLSQTTLTDLLRESVLVRGALAIIVVMGIFILSILQIEIDVRLWSIAFVVVGFFFGSASSASIAHATKANQQMIMDMLESHNDNVERIMAQAHEQIGKSLARELDKRITPPTPPA